MNLFIFALIMGVVGLVSYVQENGTEKPSIFVISFIANFFIGLLYGYLFIPFFYGPLFGLTTSVLLFGIINVLIAGINVDEITYGGFIYILFVCVVGIIALTGWSAFRADSYRKLLNNGNSIETRMLEKDFEPIDLNHVRIISEEQAEWLGNQILGEKSGAIGSTYETGKYHIQRVQSKLYWVAPLDFRSFWKWSSEATSPGFIMVDAEDRNISPKLVTTHKLKYMTSSFFGKDLERHLYFEGYSSKGLTDYSFELDDNLKPYWVVTVYEPSISYYGPEVQGVVIVDPETGISDFYDTGSVPQWVDRVYPEKFVEDYITNYGKYIHGWWNSFVSQKEIEVPTTFSESNKSLMGGNLWLIYGSDGQPYWFTGLTSISTNDKALTGIILVNSRNGKTYKYNMSGANEEAVLQAVNNKVSNFKGYRGTQPILYNIYGELTWVMPVISENILQKIAFVRAHNSTVVLGDDIQQAAQQYKNMLLSDTKTKLTNQAVIITKTGIKVERIGIENINNTTLYYLYFDKIPNKIFTMTSSISPEVTITNERDPVEITYLETEEILVGIKTFDNLSIKIK